MENLIASIEPQTMRQAYSRLAAGTTVVTLTDPHHVRMGLTATSVTSVSLEPPLMLVCINNASRVIAPLRAGNPFTINILAQDQAWIGMQFASREPDKFARVETHLSESGGLHLTGALANFECLPHDLIEAGDHHIVVGRVVGVHLGGEAQPLVFFRSRFMHESV